MRRVRGASRKEKTLEGQKPMSVTCLKMAGWQPGSNVAERLRKPVSGTVAGGLGTAGRVPSR